MSAPFNLDDSLKPEHSWHHHAGYSHLLPAGSVVPLVHVAHPNAGSDLYMWWLVRPLAVSIPAADPTGPMFGRLATNLEDACRDGEEAYERTLQP